MIPLLKEGVMKLSRHCGSQSTLQKRSVICGVIRQHINPELGPAIPLLFGKIQTTHQPQRSSLLQRKVILDLFQFLEDFVVASMIAD